MIMAYIDEATYEKLTGRTIDTTTVPTSTTFDDWVEFYSEMLNGMIGITSDLDETSAGFPLVRSILVRVMKRAQNNAALDGYEEPVDKHDRPLPELSADEWKLIDRIRGMIVDAGDPGIVADITVGGRTYT
jgi:hypothetical protein